MDIKICPACKAEYYSHVKECIDCEVELLLPEEIEEIESEKEEFLSQAGGEVVLLEEGSMDLIKSHFNVLDKRGIASYIKPPEPCKKGSCQSSAMLFVGSSDAEEAARILYDMHSAEGDEDSSKYREVDGRCPACGFDAGDSAEECPDCGLALNV